MAINVGRLDQGHLYPMEGARPGIEPAVGGEHSIEKSDSNSYPAIRNLYSA
jgi:hypothetical protein